MALSRLNFLKGAFSALGLGALGCGRVFAAPSGWKPPANPNLSFGVISDTHLRTSNAGRGLGANWPDKYFVAALTYFREQNVDAVMHCGDLAHRGQVRELEFHARAWNKVFPKNCAPDGHEVAKLFVNGNHDVEGASYGDFVAKRYPDPAVRAKHVLATDMAGNWQRIWGEPYEDVWHKEVKGYHFFGRNHNVPKEELVFCLKHAAAGLSASKASVLRKAVCAAGCNLGMGHEPGGGVTMLQVGRSELPKGERLAVTATPLTSVGTRGRAISSFISANFRLTHVGVHGKMTP